LPGRVLDVEWILSRCGGRLRKRTELNRVDGRHLTAEGLHYESGHGVAYIAIGI
jgi:hypothetical protein